MEIVRDHAPANPALCAIEAMIPAARQPVAPLQNADASLTSGPPSQAAAKPPLMLYLSLRRRWPPRRRHTDLLDPGGFCRVSFLPGPEACIGGDQAGRSSEDVLMTPNRQQVPIAVFQLRLARLSSAPTRAHNLPHAPAGRAQTIANSVPEDLRDGVEALDRSPQHRMPSVNSVESVG